jgi:transcriptional regulator with PAS, ATPase and Fis domain
MAPLQRKRHATARRTKPDLFEVALGCTFFLDELDALRFVPGLRKVREGKLLTALKAKCVRRVGAVTEHPVHIKLTAATQADLSALVAQGRSRW